MISPSYRTSKLFKVGGGILVYQRMFVVARITFSVFFLAFYVRMRKRVQGAANKAKNKLTPYILYKVYIT